MSQAEALTHKRVTSASRERPSKHYCFFNSAPNNFESGYESHVSEPFAWRFGFNPGNEDAGPATASGRRRHYPAP